MPRQSEAFSPRIVTILFYKPYGVLSQFTDRTGRLTLRDFGPFPADVYPVGRLDFDSEGLLLLTNDRFLKHRLLDPEYGHPRTYIAQVERIPSQEALQQLRDGVILDGEPTRPADVRLLPTEPVLPPRPVPIRFRKNVPTAWLELTIREGRNRQVRRMTAAVGHPTLRLVRVRFAEIEIGSLQPGESRLLNSEEVQYLRQLASSKEPVARNPRWRNKKPRRAP
jgi:23S rRNA pseudouridine2457 synthase